MESINHIVIQGWMCNELNLKGNELLVFAMIYGFSQDGETRFYGSRNYIADTFNISLPTVDKALQSLEDKNLIEVTSVADYKGTHNEYEVCKETLLGVVKKLYRGSKETLHNNIVNNKKEYNTISKDIVADDTNTRKTKKLSLWDKCVSLIEDYTDDTKLHDMLVCALKLFLENSREADKPFYTNTFKGKLNNLDKLSDDIDIQIKIVQQTLDNGWNNFYILKENNRRNKTGNVANDIEQLHSGLNRRGRKEVNTGDGTQF